MNAQQLIDNMNCPTDLFEHLKRLMTEKELNEGLQSLMKSCLEERLTRNPDGYQLFFFMLESLENIFCEDLITTFISYLEPIEQFRLSRVSKCFANSCAINLRKNASLWLHLTTMVGGNISQTVSCENKKYMKYYRFSTHLLSLFPSKIRNLECCDINSMYSPEIQTLLKNFNQMKALSIKGCKTMFVQLKECHPKIQFKSLIYLKMDCHYDSCIAISYCALQQI